MAWHGMAWRVNTTQHKAKCSIPLFFYSTYGEGASQVEMFFFLSPGGTFLFERLFCHFGHNVYSRVLYCKTFVKENAMQGCTK